MTKSRPKQPVNRSDYRPPAFTVETVTLVFDLSLSQATIDARLEINCPLPTEALFLNGAPELTLTHISIDGKELDKADYLLSDEGLTLKNPSKHFVLRTISEISPSANKAFEGLFATGGRLCTQCEPEGFRHITFFPDRPDILSRYHVTLRADATEFPTLLSNGNPVSTQKLEDGRHEAVFEDPFGKPSYLFALVAGKFDTLEGHFVTRSGKPVRLLLHAEPGQALRLQHALDSLCHAMRWDEDVYGLEYDLENYHIVAVSDFNMGAMENKGLNIFNDKYTLADPDTATDTDYKNIEAIIAHEYFHNWTGNRVTCRDWFQLSLKEGLTVFRDQSFSASRHQPKLCRVQDALRLRQAQFPEDASALAHPVRPESYLQINNFYTATVYEKGAELIRMMALFLGQKDFIKAVRRYLKKHDGKAASCDDFLDAMLEGAPDFPKGFSQWYEQSGTPRLSIKGNYDDKAHSMTITVEQKTLPTADQEKKSPLPLPLRIALFGQKSGAKLSLSPAEDTLGDEKDNNERILIVTKAQQSFLFDDISEAPVISANRGFSAPVILTNDSDDFFLMRHDDDLFARHDAFRRVMVDFFTEAHKTGITKTEGSSAANKKLGRLNECRGLVLKQVQRGEIDEDAGAFLLSSPPESELILTIPQADPDIIANQAQMVRQSFCDLYYSEMENLYEPLNDNSPFTISPKQQARRALKNRLLSFMGRKNPNIAKDAYFSANNLTDRLASLTVLALEGEGAEVIDDFFEKWGRHNKLNFGKWLSISALSPAKSVIDDLKKLMAHPLFSMTNPNSIFALLGSFTSGNTRHFHSPDGGGYAFLGDIIGKLDPVNPQVAARLSTPLCRLANIEANRSGHIKTVLEQLAGTIGISSNLSELVGKALSALTEAKT